ncbi:MAG: hypothetical protein M5R41_17195 [Bacteroidia bacterium]|nr:hypothetical protein [Bacteroidia bacterium]
MQTHAFRPALALVLISGLALLGACQFSTANIDRAVMARSVDKDNAPIEETTTFHKYENLLHCCVEMANTPEGTKVKAVWRFDEGEERGVIDSTEVDVNSSIWVDFTLALSESGLPYAKYAVDLYINGEIKQSVPFTVEPMFSESVIKEAVLATEINDNYYPVTVVESFPTNIARLFAPVFVEGQPAGSVFTAIWYQHDKSGGRMLISEYGLPFDSPGWIGFSLSLNDGLPPGKYSVDILHNGTVEHTLEFTAQ